jgi:hypothetical protein
MRRAAKRRCELAQGRGGRSEPELHSSAQHASISMAAADLVPHVAQVLIFDTTAVETGLLTVSLDLRPIDHPDAVSVSVSIAP